MYLKTSKMWKGGYGIVEPLDISLVKLDIKPQATHLTCQDFALLICKTEGQAQSLQTCSSHILRIRLSIFTHPHLYNLLPLGLGGSDNGRTDDKHFSLLLLDVKTNYQHVPLPELSANRNLPQQRCRLHCF